MESVLAKAFTPIINKKNNSRQLYGLFPGTKYEWKVKSICDRQGASSAWSVKQFFTTTNSLQENQSSTWKIYPNPVVNILYIQQLNNNSIKKIEVTDALGNVRISKKIHDSKNIISINMQTLPQGVYYVKATDAAGNISAQTIRKN